MSEEFRFCRPGECPSHGRKRSMIEVVREILSTAEPAAPKPVEETEDTVPTASNLERAIEQEVRRREATPVPAEAPALPKPLASFEIIPNTKGRGNGAFREGTVREIVR